MNKALMDGMVAKYLESYNAPAKDAIWQQHSATFRRFWSEQVLAQEKGAIPDDACDAIIRILDRHGKGNTRDSEAVARVMVPQGVWRRIFNSIHSDRDLARLIDSIFTAEEPGHKATLIDELYRTNEGKKNSLTGKSGSVITAFIAAFDPVNNLTVISLKHRKAQIDFLDLVLPFDWVGASVGQRIVRSNLLLREATRALGVDGSARTQSCFWYFEPVKALWKPGEHTVKLTDKKVTVTVPEDIEAENEGETAGEDREELRESLQVQAVLAEIGSLMGFRIWLPKSDRNRVLTKWTPEPGELLDELPPSYDPTTMKTIEQIDVIWLKRRSIVRAFEVEHTTSVYSGLLRMADLIALQPNLNIKLHIVAPESRREKVFQEIRRPVFSLLEGRALSEICSYLSYDIIAQLREQKHLEHLSDHVLEDYEEKAEEAD